MRRIAPALLLSVVGLALLAPEVVAQAGRHGGGAREVGNDDTAVESFNKGLVLLIICVLVVVVAITATLTSTVRNGDGRRVDLDPRA